MSEKILNSRIINKHDSAENWSKATNFIPKQGEVIIYDIDSTYTYERVKVGDGKTLVSNLPFVDDALRVELLTKIDAVSTLVGDTSVSDQISNAIAEIPEQIQANWSQNDETAKDYIKNRPFYETDEKEIIIAEPRTVEGFNGGWATNTTHFAFEDGTTYTVIFDDVEYPNLVSTNDGYGSIILGNRYLWDSEEQNDLPFALIFEPGGDSGEDWCYVVSTNEEATTHTLEIKGIGTEIIKIDEKFLPDVVAERGDHISSVVFTKHNATANAPYSFAHGAGCVASGYSSHAEGRRTVAEGGDSHAEGFETKVSTEDIEPGTVYHVSEYNDKGEYAHAEGMSTVAIGAASHAEGAGTKTAAAGLYAHAEGLKTLASQSAAHAEGEETIASGDSAHAEGLKTQSNGYASHAEGRETYADGHYSHAEGYGTKAMYRSQHVEGEYNIVDKASPDVESYRGNYVRIVGNGTAENVRSNAHTLDWSGNAWFAGDVYIGGTSQDNATKLTPGVMPNLLDNWYFADPVNSQGRTSYLSGTYAIDRWFMRTSHGIIVDGGFQVYNADGISFYGITQALNNPTQYCGKTVTFSAKFTEINTASAIEMKIASSTQVSGVGTVINEIKNITTPGIYSVTTTIPSTLPSTTLAVWITCRDADVGASYTIESVKLELGSVSTLALDSMPNKADQVARCSNYDASGAFLNTLFATQAFVLKYVPKIANITLRAANWTFSSNAYYQDVALSCVTTTSKVDLQPAYYQLAEWQSDGLAFSTVSQNGAVRVWVTDVAPKEDITIQVTVQEVMEV